MDKFDKLWSLTISSTFHEVSAKKLYEVALDCKGIYVEVGVNRGGSATMLLGAARETGAKVFLIDSWVSVLRDNKEKVKEYIKEHFADIDCEILHMDALEGARVIKDKVGEIDLLHLDADNGWKSNLEENCEAWLPLLKSRGMACIFDYNSHSFPDVKKIVDKVCEGWEDMGVAGALAVRRKP
jgi:predicted O-methyltransferase YrrM